MHNQSYIVDARGSSLLFSLGFFNNDECWHEPFYFHVVTTSFPSVYLSRSSLLLPSYNSTIGPYPLSSHIKTKKAHTDSFTHTDSSKRFLSKRFLLKFFQRDFFRRNFFEEISSEEISSDEISSDEISSDEISLRRFLS